MARKKTADVAAVIADLKEALGDIAGPATRREAMLNYGCHKGIMTRTGPMTPEQCCRCSRNLAAWAAIAKATAAGF